MSTNKITLIFDRRAEQRSPTGTADTLALRFVAKSGAYALLQVARVKDIANGEQDEKFVISQASAQEALASLNLAK